MLEGTFKNTWRFLPLRKWIIWLFIFQEKEMKLQDPLQSFRLGYGI